LFGELFNGTYLRGINRSSFYECIVFADIGIPYFTSFFIIQRFMQECVRWRREAHYEEVDGAAVDAAGLTILRTGIS
jgi:hypothetical protein